MTLALVTPTLCFGSMFGAGAPLPADVQQRLLTGQVYPEDAAALVLHMDAYAAEADRQREAVIDGPEATRAREKAVFEAESARFKRFQEGSLPGLLRPCRHRPSLKRDSSGASRRMTLAMAKPEKPLQPVAHRKQPGGVGGDWDCAAEAVG